MGPNPIKLLEELLEQYPVNENSTVLDLGCGCGITSIFMVKEYNLRVFATDLWINATDNWKRFQEEGMSSEEIIPIHSDAHEMQFAENFFDAIVSIDAYQYFGCNEEYLSKHLLPLVKPDGKIIIAVPGLKKELNGFHPEEFSKSWTAEDVSTFHDTEWWRKNIEATEGIEILSIHEMESFEECWNDWLETDHEYAISDRPALEAGAGKYMNFVAIVLEKK